MSSFFLLLASLAVLFLISCSLDKGFAFQTTRNEAIQRNLIDLQYSHLVHLNSLLPSATCNSSTKGSRSPASLKVVHKDGACSQLNQNKSNKAHTDILSEDQERVNYIHSKLSKKFVLDSAVTLPAKNGLIINGPANYYVVVGLGTPKKEVSLAFDTGSDLTWTQCEPCAGSCYKQKDEIFDPSKSSTYSNIACTSSICSQLYTATGNRPNCSSSSNACIYGIRYGDSSFSIGYFSRDRLTVTATNTIDNFLLGCGQNNQGIFGGYAGLLGLGRHPISFVQQTAMKYGKIFSYCIPSTPSNVGYLNFGNARASNIIYTPFSTITDGSSFYGLDITGITVGGTQLPVSSNTFSAGGAIIDSGTVITRLPPTIYNALREAFRQGMAKYPKSSFQSSLLDTCYDLSGYQVVNIPKISFTFGGGVTLELAAVGSVYSYSVRQVCLAFAANKDDSYTTIFGNVQQKTFQVVYDVGSKRVGFGAGGCE